MSSARVLIVDDEPKLAKILCVSLEGAGHRAEAVHSGEEAVEALEREPFDVVLTDLKMPGMDGLALLREIKRRRPETDVVMMTAYASTETAIEAMKRGAADYLIKPFPVEELRMLLGRIAETRGLREENARLRAEVADRARIDNVIAASGAMERVLRQVRKVARTNASVLLRGESGTGKEVLATAVHHQSARAQAPLIKVNCGAIPESLLEAELFGHVKGAFTGAIATRDGHFQAADGGTLFLDEVAEMPPHVQVKLLRALQEGEIARVGDSRVQRVDVRVIAATNQNLEAMMEQGSFRQDLYYRLNVVPIFIPPLRERPEDIPPLIEHFCRTYAPDGAPRPFTREAYDLLLRYPWPGNVRELQNAVQHAMVMGEPSGVDLEDLPLALRQWAGCAEAPAGAAAPGAGGNGEAGTLDALEAEAIRDALLKTGGNQTRAARLLGITRRTLGYRMKKHRIRVGPEGDVQMAPGLPRTSGGGAP